MTEQISLFDGAVKYKITKPIRLIELFGGIGAQSKALERLQVPFTAWRYCEIDKYAVQSYNAVHGTKFAPTDITQLHAEDLAVEDTDKYEYIMTYSFPCQDLSNAGLQRGMTKGSGTRSGLLWEVERLLDEMTERPQILLMENVPQVIGANAIKDFALWIAKLEELGYKNYWRVLNATGFGVPQNRQRCYMVSLLGDYRYSFPREKPLKKVLLDLLETEVDEKYYLSESVINYFVKHTEENKEKGNGFCFKPTDGNGIARTILTKAGSRMDDNFILVPENTKQGYAVAREGDSINLAYPTSKTRRGRVEKGVAQTLTASNNDMCVCVGMLQGGKWENTYDSCRRVYDPSAASPTITTCGGGNTEPKIIIPDSRFYAQAVETLKDNECEDGDTIDAYNMRVNKSGICPTITTRPEGFKTAVLPVQNLRVRKLTPRECWRLMDFDDEDFDKAKATGISDSQLYKQAGNSIVVAVLQAIFGELI